MEQYDDCPCDTCVTCACCAVPLVDEDGLCVGCGGTPLAIAQRVPGGKKPHRSLDVSTQDGIRIDEIIREGIC